MRKLIKNFNALGIPMLAMLPLTLQASEGDKGEVGARRTPKVEQLLNSAQDGKEQVSKVLESSDPEKRGSKQLDWSQGVETKAAEKVSGGIPLYPNETGDLPSDKESDMTPLSCASKGLSSWANEVCFGKRVPGWSKHAEVSLKISKLSFRVPCKASAGEKVQEGWLDPSMGWSGEVKLPMRASESAILFKASGSGNDLAGLSPKLEKISLGYSNPSFGYLGAKCGVSQGKALDLTQDLLGYYGDSVYDGPSYNGKQARLGYTSPSKYKETFVVTVETPSFEQITSRISSAFGKKSTAKSTTPSSGNLDDFAALEWKDTLVKTATDLNTRLPVTASVSWTPLKVLSLGLSGGTDLCRLFSSEGIASGEVGKLFNSKAIVRDSWLPSGSDLKIKPWSLGGGIQGSLSDRLPGVHKLAGGITANYMRDSKYYTLAKVDEKKKPEDVEYLPILAHHSFGVQGALSAEFRSFLQGSSLRFAPFFSMGYALGGNRGFEGAGELKLANASKSLQDLFLVSDKGKFALQQNLFSVSIGAVFSKIFKLTFDVGFKNLWHEKFTDKFFSVDPSLYEFDDQGKTTLKSAWDRIGFSVTFKVL